MGEIVAIVVLGVAVVALLVDRYFYTRRMHEQLDDILKAALSRNISEYLSAKSTPKDLKGAPPAQEDLVPLEEASDEEFDKALGINKTK